MKLVHDAEDDIASILLGDVVAEGEVAQDVGPQLTPNRQTVTMGYDLAGNLLSIEIWAASRVLRPTLLRSGIVHIDYDEVADIARLRLVDEQIDDSELLVVGPQLTPTADRIVLTYDKDDFLVGIEIEGASRVLRDEALE